MLRRSPHLSAAAASLVAIAVAIGVATPRSRTARDRTPRAVSLVGSARAELRCPRVQLDDDHDIDISADHGRLAAHEERRTADAPARLPAGVEVRPPGASSIVVQFAFGDLYRHLSAGLPLGRAPPFVLS